MEYMSKEKDIEYSIQVKFTKNSATIDTSDKIGAGEFAHGIAILILAFNNQLEGRLEDTMSGIVDSINNIHSPDGETKLMQNEK